MRIVQMWCSLVFAAALLSACGGKDPEPQAGKAEGREETRSIRNTEAIGYSGDAIADKVDAALDANDQRKDELDEAIDEASE
ncbi:MAG: hypothetical protein PHP86_00945 [Nevskiales bacterium]|nr:hypothetical protein [Nevskiales bacterium]